MTTESELTPYTERELAVRMMQHLMMIAREWASYEHRTVQERCEGVVHSTLAMLDGCMPGVPMYHLVASPNPEDKEYLISEGERWVEPGTIITEDISLHDMWHAVKSGKA